MKSSFAARRKARVVGQDATDLPSGDGPPTADSGDEQESTPIVKRPPNPSRAPSKKSSFRLSFNPSSTPTTSPDIPNPSEIFNPRKSALSRRAIEKNALRKSRPPQPSSHLPLRPPDDDRPSYSASALHEFRNSTPSTPQAPRSPSPTDPPTSRALDIFSKFGSDLSRPPPATAIPTDAEIQEKKARRARLAHEQDYINLSPPPSSTTSLLPPNSHRASRLRRSSSSSSSSPASSSSSRLPLSAPASRSHRRHQTHQLRTLIHAAENPSDSDSGSSDSQNARHAASQLRFGAHSALPRPRSRRRQRTPPRITPLPQLSACLERLHAALRVMEERRAGRVREGEGVGREREEIAGREGEVRRLLGEKGEEYERLSGEVGWGLRLGMGVGGGIMGEG